MTSKFYFSCINCGKKIPAEPFQYLCPECKQKNNDVNPPNGILKTHYNYDNIRKKYQPEQLFSQLNESGFLDLLPIESLKNLSPLRVGNTPLYEHNRLGSTKLDHKLLLKDDSQNPTFSYKDRASNLVSAYAKEKNIGSIVSASTGNAGSSLAGICASQGQKAIIMAPASAPKAKLIQICMYGATLIPVAGSYDDAFDLSIKATEKYGWFNRNTAFNPFTIEGKKTAAFEIYEQLDQSLPDRIFVPAGDGVIISGIYKGFEDLKSLGIINKIPVIVAIQSQGSDNLVNNLKSLVFKSRPSSTIADSIAVDIPRNFYMARDYLLNEKGEWVTVSDKEIIEASHLLSESTGIFSEPAAVASFAGYRKYSQNKKIAPDSRNIVLLTGSGLKDIKAVDDSIEIPQPVQPDLDSLEKSGLIKHRKIFT